MQSRTMPGSMRPNINLKEITWPTSLTTIYFKLEEATVDIASDHKKSLLALSETTHSRLQRAHSTKYVE